MPQGSSAVRLTNGPYVSEMGLKFFMSKGGEGLIPSHHCPVVCSISYLILSHKCYIVTKTFKFFNENLVKIFVSRCWKSTSLFQPLCVARSRLERKRDVTRITENTCVIACRSRARFLRCYKYTERLRNNASSIDSCFVLKNQGLTSVFVLSQT